MTACATVTDVLALSPNPARLGLDRIRLALGIGTDRARVVRELAIEAHKRRVLSLAADLGVTPREAESALWEARP